MRMFESAADLAAWFCKEPNVVVLMGRERVWQVYFTEDGEADARCIFDACTPDGEPIGRALVFTTEAEYVPDEEFPLVVIADGRQVSKIQAHIRARTTVRAGS